MTRGDGRQRLIETHLERAAAVAAHVARRVPQGAALVGRADLVQEALAGLCQAADGFDPGRGVLFWTYAAPRVRGAVVDALRRADPLDRGWRRRVRAGTAADPGPAVDLETVEALRGEIADGGADGGDPAAAVVTSDLRRWLWGTAEAHLDARDVRVLRARFDQQRRLRETAAAEGLSITRVGEIEQRALRRLRAILEGMGGTP